MTISDTTEQPVNIDELVNQYVTRYSDTRSKNGIPVVIFPSFVTLKWGSIDKTISLEDFHSIISANLSNLHETNESILLPKGTYLFSKSVSKISIGCYFPEEKRKVTFQNYRSDTPKEFVIPFPNTVITFDLEKIGGSQFYTVGTTQYYLTSKKLSEMGNGFNLNNSEGVFHMPFNNFYTNGAMCYGGNTMPRKISATNFKPLNYYYDVIFDSPFNSDLGIKGISNANEFSRNNAKFYEYLSTLETFPYELMTRL